MGSLLKLLAILSASGGFLLASYIRNKKRSQEKLICPLGSDCNVVIHSKYSTIFGIPLELLGTFYYGIVIVGYTLFLIFPEFPHPQLLHYGIIAITIFAFLFSLYLTFIQAVMLKQWCIWCLTSAGLCTVIFISVLLTLII